MMIHDFAPGPGVWRSSLHRLKKLISKLNVKGPAVGFKDSTLTAEDGCVTSEYFVIIKY
jgi:hypothetical protein